MPASSDPALLLLYGLDESLPTAGRANSGYLGSAQDLTVYQSTGSDGILAVSDGNGGRAAWFDVTYPSPYSSMASATRALRGAAGTGSTHAAKPTLPLAAATDDFAIGARFKWVAGETDGSGATEGQFIFGLAGRTSSTLLWMLAIIPNTNANPATGARLRVYFGDNGNIDVGGGSWTETGSPPTQHILPDEWYRVVVRVYWNGASAFLVKVYLVRESTGAIYTFTYNAAAFSTNYASAALAATDVNVSVGYDGGGGSNPVPIYGYVDECWLYDAPLSDSDATSLVTGGFSVPWTAPSYRRADHVVYAAVTNEGSAFPQTRALPTGCLAARFPPDRAVQRARVRVEGWRPGRPWLLRSVEGVFDTVGPYSSKAGNRFRLDDPNRGLYRAGGELPAGAWEDARDVRSTDLGPRRRAGFRVRRNVATDQGDTSANGFFFFRSNADVLYGLYKVGSKLYEEQGSAAAALDSGWNSQQQPVFAYLDGRAIILTAARRKTWRGTTGSVESLGISAPSSLSAAAGSGGTLNGTYYYAYTEYDPTTGDESAPKVLASPVSPSTQKVTLTLDAVNSDTRFSKRRIYRTTNGGSPPNLFLIDTVTSATSYNDTGAADGTQAVGQVTDTSDTLLGYITGELPDSFSMACVHMERVFYAGGSTYPERVYATEANEVQRFYTGAYLVCEGPVRALVSWGHRLVAFTDTTVEIFESDWVRDADGNRSIQRTVVSRRVGCVGPNAVVSLGPTDALFWQSRNGFYTMRSTIPEPVSEPIADLFPYVNHGISRRSVVSYNHVRQQIWCSIAHATLQDDSDRFQTVLVLDLEALAKGVQKWTVYRLEAAFHGAFDDDRNGQQFGIIDHLGCFKQGESFEGDGAEGNESYTTEDDGGSSGSVGIQSIAGSVVTVYGTPGWTAGALRGMAVVFRDRSTGLLYWHPISTNTTTALTVVGTPNAALAARDGWYIGGIPAYVQFAEQGLATPNAKVVRQVHLEFADLTNQDLYL